MAELEYKCYYQDCRKSYKTKYNLRRHINTNHLFIKEFSCATCGKSFASKQNLQGHEQLHKQQIIMPELESMESLVVSHRTVHEDIKELRLSKIYVEHRIIVNCINTTTKGVMPILPPICCERATNSRDSRLPVIPILL